MRAPLSAIGVLITRWWIWRTRNVYMQRMCVFQSACYIIAINMSCMDKDTVKEANYPPRLLRFVNI